MSRILFLFISLFLFLSCYSFADVTETHTLTVIWEMQNMPADLKEYEIKCQPDDSLTTKFNIDDVEEKTDDAGNKTYEQTGDVLTTSGVFSCRMRAFDQANQASQWSAPYVLDPPPNAPVIITITSPDVVVNINQ